MKNLLQAIGKHAPALKPFTDAIQADMAADEADHEQQKAEFEKRRAEMRAESEARRQRIMNRP